MTPAVATHVGGCQCGLVRYEVTAELGPVFHCHCAFCRRIHGAAFTTIALLPREAFDWLSGSGHVARFLTPGGSLLAPELGPESSPASNRLVSSSKFLNPSKTVLTRLLEPGLVFLLAMA